jgi:glycerol-3-phosphate dehydrogenase (NAD(P)+)
MSEVTQSALPQVKIEQIAALYGPSHAEEVSRHQPTTVVAASVSKETAKYVQETFRTAMFRVYINTDLVGVEIAGSVKNIMAIAAGIADGIGYGDNAKAAIVTRGLAEISRQPADIFWTGRHWRPCSNMLKQTQPQSICRRANRKRQDLRANSL